MNIDELGNTCLILDFEFAAKEPVPLPAYMGSALRGAMGHEFLRCCCNKPAPDCSECSHICVYPQFFSRIDRSKNPKDTLPNPYVFYHHGDGHRSDRLRFSMTIFGNGIEHSDFVIQMIKSGCANGLTVKRIPFLLESVSDCKCAIFVDTGESAREVSLCFDTPLQIRTSGAGVVWSLSFEVLMRNIIRRMRMLGVAEIPVAQESDLLRKANDIAVISNSLKPYYMERYSNRKKARLSLSGLTGTVTFSGELSEFMPFLRAGELLHVGKACPMGLGHYSISAVFNKTSF